MGALCLLVSNTFHVIYQHEKLPQAKAYMVFGIFSALLWMLPTAGGC